MVFALAKITLGRHTVQRCSRMNSIVASHRIKEETAKILIDKMDDHAIPKYDAPRFNFSDYKFPENGIHTSIRYSIEEYEEREIMWRLYKHPQGKGYTHQQK